MQHCLSAGKLGSAKRAVRSSLRTGLGGKDLCKISTQTLRFIPPPLLLIRPKPPQNKGGINLAVPKSEVDFEVFRDRIFDFGHQKWMFQGKPAAG